MKEVNKLILAKTLCLLVITKNTYPVVHSEFHLLRHLKQRAGFLINRYVWRIIYDAATWGDGGG